MRLLDKYNRTSLITTIMVIVITGFIYYFTISYILTDQVDKDLMVEENEIFDYVKLNHRLPQVFKSEDLKIRFEKIGADTVIRKFADTRYFNEQDHDEESGRSLISSVKVGTQYYRINITESKVETEYLIRVIFLITLAIVFILLVVLLLVNRLLMRNLWQPFYAMLQQIKQFNLADQRAITPLNTRIEEFNDMNREVTSMSQRATQDYRTLKDFVENAAHELMTPVAVINSKLDNLAQDSDLTNRQGKLISEIYDTLGKLTRLNRSMLLLSRIENKLMPDQEEIEIAAELKQKLTEFHELLTAREITTETAMQPCRIRINRDLLVILLNNLIGNAIRHNRTGGKVLVKLSSCLLEVTNTGVENPLDGEAVFQRFYKSSESDGTGLGLTLVKEICDSCGFLLRYTYLDGLHGFSINFKPQIL